MARKPTVSNDSVAQDQIRAFTDRILRMRQEAQAIKDDIKEIYAEAKGNGFDKTALGNLVRHLEMDSDGHAKEMERDALFDLYLAAYTGTPSRTHAHAREDDDDSDHFPDPGNMVTEPALSVPKADAAAGEGSGQERPAALASQSHPVANVGEEANGADAAASVDPASREVDAADRQRLSPSGFTGDAAVAPQPLSLDASDEPGQGATAAESPSAPDKPGEPTGSPAPVIKFGSKKPLRPYCNPLPGKLCGGYGKVHCGRCLAEHANRIPVEAGGEQVEHRGTVQ